MMLTTHKKPGLLVAALFLFCGLHAQDREKYDEIAKKYKGENAVYTDITERLIISRGDNDSDLVAKSDETKEKLFLTDMSLNRDNMDYCFHSEFHELTDITAVAYLPEGDGYKRVESYSFGEGRPRDYVFYDDNRIVEAIYSGLKKNAITSTHYTIEHTDIHMLPTFFLQEDIPVAHATFEIVAPDYVNISFVMKGLNTSWFQQSKEEKNGNTIYRFTADNVPAFKNYSHVPSVRYYMPHIIPYITSYTIADRSRPIKVLDDAAALHRYDYKYLRNRNMTMGDPLKRTVKQLTRDDITARDKAEHIYKWVQQNVHYIAFEKGLEGFTPREADTVFKRRFGDCKDMASILVAMLREAGMKAYFTTIGTRELPYVHDETPVQQLYNHMICALKLGGDWIFLDATDPALPFGANRPDIQGKEAMISIDSKNYEIATIPVEPADRSLTYDSCTMNLGYDKVTGTAAIRYEGYPAWGMGEYLDLYHKKDERDKAVRAITSRGSNKYLVDHYNVNCADQGNRNVDISADYSIGDYVQKIDNRCYVNMNVKRTFEDFRVNEPERKVAYYHDYKEKIKEVVTLNIPEGYHLASLPKNAQGGLDDMWSYKITYTTDSKQASQAKKVTLTKEYVLNTMAVGPEKFADNNKLADQLKNIYKETVVLTGRDKTASVARHKTAKKRA